MQKLSWLIYLFFSKRKIVFTILIIACCSALGYYASRIKLEEDISKFVPLDKNSSDVSSILENLKAKDKLVIHFSSENENNIDQLVEKADIIFDTLQKSLGKNKYANITYKISDNTMQSIYGIFYNNLPFFLSDKEYQKIAQLINPDSINLTLKKDYEALLSPSGIVLSKFITRDPLNIVPLALKKLQDIQLDENFETYNGAIVTKDHKHLLMFITPAFAANETKSNKPLIDFVKNCTKRLSNHEINVESFGACVVSLGNAEQLKKDTTLTTTVAIILIALLIIIYFKNPLPVIFIFLPVVFGMGFSLAMLFLFKGVVSAIAIGSGAVVLGIAINYSMHFFTHYKHTRNVKTVLQDLTVPMLIGCTTTVGAFFALSFTKSEALHDFGQFAGFSLIGALTFSILVLPHLLKISFKKEIPVSVLLSHQNLFEKIVSYRYDKNKIIVFVSFILTIILTVFASNVSFESDMNKMSYMDDETGLAEKHLDEVNNFAARSVYIFTSGDNFEEALQLNEFVSQKLDSLKDNKIIKKFSSVSSVFPSQKMQTEKLNKWNTFFNREIKDSLQRRLITLGNNYKFKSSAFSLFNELLNKQFSNINKQDADTLNKLLLKEWVTTAKNKPTIINHIKVDAVNKEIIYKLFANQNNIVVFDKQHLTSQFVDIISSDFSTILWITSILVFGFMLFNHGRIELAVINFLPMVISWLWILGIMGIFGIKFNIINIIISTFIFGLGDDYSIFIMDGLMNENKYGKKNLNSYKTSILLSALTTIIGIGVMVFAKHPALKSIALITIIGMVCVVFVSFIVQPLIFNWMILSRKKRGLRPYTLKNLLITVVGFSVFVFFAFILTGLGFIIFTIVPGNLKKRKYFFHFIIMYAFRIILFAFVTVRKKVINEHMENFKNPVLIVANHQSHVDLALTLQLYPKIVAFTNDAVYNSPYYGPIVKMADHYPTSAGYENSITKLETMVKDGYSILIFPEGTRSLTGEIGRFHKGAFLLAEKLNIDILPLLIHGAGDSVTKGDFHFKPGALTVKLLKRIKTGDSSYGATYQERAKGICKHMREEYELLKEECEPVSYFRPRLIHNYFFRGPLLEWYCRVKTAMEGNYKLFDSLLPKQGSIIDVGCGYGFLPYMLMYKSKHRKILGLDYDDEKIVTANNCADKNSQLQFETADVTKYNYPNADGIVISDVLHYLEPEQQITVLEKLAKSLNKNGVLVIRDADADLKTRQAGTSYTEFVSTGVGFNKTSGKGLHFVSGKLIRESLAKFPNLQLEIIDNTKLTSNIIYVARYL